MAVCDGGSRSAFGWNGPSISIGVTESRFLLGFPLRVMITSELPLFAVTEVSIASGRSLLAVTDAVWTTFLSRESVVLSPSFDDLSIPKRARIL